MVEVGLNPIELEDLPLLQSWRNSPEVMTNCRQYRPLSMKDMMEWYQSKDTNTDYNLTTDLFLLTCNNRKVGVGGLVRIDWRNRIGELSFYIGLARYRNKKVIGKLLLSVVEHSFSTLGLRKVVFPVYSFNPLLPIYETLLKREYIAESEYYWEGKYWDRIILVAYGK